MGNVLCASRHVAEPEPPDTGNGSRAVGLIFEVLCTGVPDLQGTDNDPRAHLRRGDEPAGGANTFSLHNF
jgi:hypothetical protein